MYKLQLPKPVFEKAIQQIKMDDRHKSLLSDKLLHNKSIPELQSIYHLSRASVYYQLNKAKEEFNSNLHTIKDRNIFSFLENLKKVL